MVIVYCFVNKGSVDGLGLIYGPTHDLRTGPNGPRILRTTGRVLKVITLEISFSVTFHCVKADEKHPNWFFGELF